ncbi:hypothetical protein WM40_25055, partial [Robbsia andropogonis]
YTRGTRRREMGLGPLSLVSLAEARALALECRKLHLSGADPIEVRRQKLAAVHPSSAIPTFSECCTAYIDAAKSGWKSEKQAAIWAASLEKYASKYFDQSPITEVSTALVHQALSAIWTKIPETANRVRGRIEAVIDRDSTKNNRRRENPARWKGHLDNLLPCRSKVQKVQHHPALPIEKLEEFFIALRKRTAVSRLALEFTILTAARTNEVIGAKLSEFHLAEGIWTVPGDRMKSGRQHRVPLCARAVEIVCALANSKNVFIFKGKDAASPLSNMAMLKLLQVDLGQKGITVHGFRSTFRDWIGESTTHSNEVAEAALAHIIGDKAEAAYRRGDMFTRRRTMMVDWAIRCGVGTSTETYSDSIISRK